MGISGRAYAKHRGVAANAVVHAIKRGRIVLEPDGTIDVAKADASWIRSTDPTKGGDRRKPMAVQAPAYTVAHVEVEPRVEPRVEAPRLKPVPDHAIASVRETLREQGLTSDGGVSFLEARTAHEISKAHLARMKAQKTKGELVDRAPAMALVFKLAREERDAWTNWPARVAALMASEFGADAHAMQTALDGHVREMLAELSEIKPEFG